MIFERFFGGKSNVDKDKKRKQEQASASLRVGAIEESLKGEHAREGFKNVSVEQIVDKLKRIPLTDESEATAANVDRMRLALVQKLRESGNDEELITFIKKHILGVEHYDLSSSAVEMIGSVKNPEDRAALVRFVEENSADKTLIDNVRREYSAPSN